MSVFIIPEVVSNIPVASKLEAGPKNLPVNFISPKFSSHLGVLIFFPELKGSIGIFLMSSR